MMLNKSTRNKGRKALAMILSVLLGLSLSFGFAPLTAYAEGEDAAGNGITPEAGCTVTITLTSGETEADASVYDALTLRTDSSETSYTLTEKQAVLPEGTYFIYLNEKKLLGTELIVGADTPTEFTIHYYTLAFTDNDSEVARYYITADTVVPDDVPGTTIPAKDGYTFLGWTLDNGSLMDWTLPITADTVVTALWEPNPEPEDHEADTTIWETDPFNHWHKCKVEGCTDRLDFADHTAGDWITDKEATTTEEGSRHKECTTCKYILQTEVIPKVTPKSPKHEADTSKWETDAENHWHKCTIEGCTDKLDLAKHNFDTGVETVKATEEAEGTKTYTCETCGYVKTETIQKLPHTHKFGTEWTSDDTSHWHECPCGSKAEMKPHTAGDWITDKQPTVSAEGSRHKECTACKKVMATETIAKLIPPKITAGAGQIFHSGSGKDLVITCSGNMEDLTGVYVDNGAVHKSNYTVASGSTILTLKAAYLESLAGGTHSLKLAYRNGTTAETQFTIQKTTAVKTGDTTNYIPLIILLILSGGVLIVTSVIRKRGLNG